MSLAAFVDCLRRALPEGSVLANPGGGTTTIVWHDRNKLCYMRGESRFYVALEDLYKAYSNFEGSDMSTRDLKAFAPHVFDSNAKGHNCNATVLMLALHRMDASSAIWGRGRPGAPFGVTVKTR
jgi:hypothetical protein